jgi:hypothetical protein
MATNNGGQPKGDAKPSSGKGWRAAKLFTGDSLARAVTLLRLFNVWQGGFPLAVLPSPERASHVKRPRQ